MGPIVFTILSVAIAFLWVPKGIVRLPITPRILNLPVVFSFLFLMFYTQHIFIREVVFDIRVSHWLVLSGPQREMALAFLIIYFATFWLAYAVHSDRIKLRHRVLPINFFAAGVAIAILALGSLILYIEATGGLNRFMTNHRETVYLNQWSRSSEAVFTNRIRIITGLIFTIAAIVGGYLLSVHEKASPLQKLLYYSLPLPGTLVKIALISRGFFLLYALFYLSKFVISRKRVRYINVKIFGVTALVIFGTFLALHSRASDAITLNGAHDIILFVSNSVNGLSPFLDTVAISLTEFGGGLLRVLLELSPIPSFIYSSPYQSNLTTLVFGHEFGSSAPMPFIGEAFFNMGWGGLALAYLQGFVSALVNSRVANPAIRDRGWWLLLYITSVYSFLYMPHSGIRSCTRPLVWVFMLYGVWTLLRTLAPKRRRVGLRSIAPRARAVPKSKSD
jgi:hypothetical protein